MNTKVSKVQGKSEGLKITLQVMAGDTIDISAKAFYNMDNSLPGASVNIAPIVGAALAGMTAPAGGALGEASQLAENLGTPTMNWVGLVELPQKNNQKNLVQPKSGINFVLYNNVFDVVEENTGYLPVDDKINSIQNLSTDLMIMKEAGFLEVFVNNEAQTPVYYDNLTVTMRGGVNDVIEVNAYYPFGMMMPGLSIIAPPAKFNAYKHSAKEIQRELELKWYDHGNRMLDYTFSRWITPDPMAEKGYAWSPYCYAFNNPVKYIDPDGRFPMGTHSKMVADAFRGILMSNDVLNQMKLGASMIADISLMNDQRVHLDNMQGYSTISSLYTNAIKGFQSSMEQGFYLQAGVELHTVADFYSHSNYIELYKGFAEKNGLSMDIKKIPTFSEAMKNPELMKHLQDNGFKTGTFNNIVQDKLTNDKNAHGNMNLDTNSSPAGKEAYNNNNTMHEAAMSAAQRELDELAKKSNKR